MAFDVKIQVKKSFTVPADVNVVYQLLADVPASTSHFPDLDNLIEETAGTYRWEMKKLGLGPINLQTIYACKYLCNEEKKSVTWEPRNTVNSNAVVSGEWIIKESASGCDITLLTDAIMTIPLPSLTGIALKPVVKAEFETLTDRYIKNLSKTLSTVDNKVTA